MPIDAAPIADPFAPAAPAAPGAPSSPSSPSSPTDPAIPVQLAPAREPWNNEEVIAGLEEIVGGGAKWLLQLACAKKGKIAPSDKALDDAKFGRKATRSALVLYPGLADQDPRWLIVGEFLGMCGMIIRQAPPIPDAAPQG